TTAETALTNGKVSKAGDTITGNLKLPIAGPITNDDAATKKYVDDTIGNPTNVIQNQTAIAQNASFSIAGNATIGGNINLTGSIQTGARMRYYSIPAAAFHTTIINGTNTGG